MNTPANHLPTNGHSAVGHKAIHSPHGRILLPESMRLQVRNSCADKEAGSPATSECQREIHFRVCDDGTLLELVRKRSGTLTFAAYRNGTHTLCETYQQGPVLFLPPEIHQSTAEAVKLPSSVGNVGNARTLLEEIESVFAMYLDTEEAQRKLMSHFALSTWLSDLLPVAPYLWIVGPHSSGKTSALQLLATVCRRGLTIGDISAPSLCQLMDRLRPTLLLDEFETLESSRNRSLQTFLRNGSTQGGRVFRGTRAYDVFGPKAIASRHSSNDTALASRALFISMRPTSRHLSALTTEVLNAIEDRMQPKLLRFRLENYGKAKVVTETLDLSPRMYDIARALFLPLGGDGVLEREVKALLQPHNMQASYDRYREPEWIVTIALYSRIHRATNILTVQELTAKVDEVLAKAGETYTLSPRKVGEILRSLGFQTERLGNRGRGFRISRHLLREIHKNAGAMGVCRADILEPEASDGGWGGPPCKICMETGLMVDFRGRKLKCKNLYSGQRHRNKLYQ